VNIRMLATRTTQLSAASSAPLPTATAALPAPPHLGRVRGPGRAQRSAQARAAAAAAAATAARPSRGYQDGVYFENFEVRDYEVNMGPRAHPDPSPLLAHCTHGSKWRAWALAPPPPQKKSLSLGAAPSAAPWPTCS
jgi:hypothetical protein